MLSVAVEDALDESLYRAKLAGYDWGVSAGQGLGLSISGYSGDKLETLAQSVAAALLEPAELPAGRFDALSSLHKRAISSAVHDNLYSVGRGYLAGQAFENPTWSWGEQTTGANAVTWESAVNRGKKIRSESALTCLAHGDV